MHCSDAPVQVIGPLDPDPALPKHFGTQERFEDFCPPVLSFLDGGDPQQKDKVVPSGSSHHHTYSGPSLLLPPLQRCQFGKEGWNKFLTHQKGDKWFGKKEIHDNVRVEHLYAKRCAQLLHLDLVASYDMGSACILALRILQFG